MQKHNVQLVPIYFSEPRQDEISIILAQEYHRLMPIVILVSAYFQQQEHNIKIDLKFIEYDKIRKMNILIILTYLISWIYILILTVQILNIDQWETIITILRKFRENFNTGNPFE